MKKLLLQIYVNFIRSIKAVFVNIIHLKPLPKQISKKKIGFLAITFNTKEDHIKFNETRKTLGPLTLGQLTGNSNIANDKIIYSKNRLTKTNIEISRELNLLKKDGKIDEIRFRNSCIQYKRGNNDFVPVSTLDQLINLKCQIE